MNKIFLIVLLLVLSACGGAGSKTIRKEPIRPILTQTKNALAQKYRITNPDIVLIYGLGTADARAMTNIDYVNIVNSSKYSKQFVQSSKLNIANVQNHSSIKIRQLQEILLELKKNNIHVSQSLMKSGISNFNKLVKFHHKIGRFLPILTPAASPRISSHYGPRFHPVHKVKKFHYGIDLASCRRLIFAAAEGVIGRVEKNHKGYGNSITVDHLNGFKTFYAHLEHILVSKNQKVLQGELIATEGKTGAATGVHLHFETIYKNQRINPAIFLNKSLN
jgi:hypothetical protein